MCDGKAYRVLGLVALTVGLVVAFTPLDELAGHWLDVPARLEPAGAIVVLGSSILADGTLNGTSLLRAIHGIRLFRRGLAPVLVFLGDPGRDGGPAEPTVRAALAQELGVPGSAILAVTARTTREEATRARAALEARGVRRILLVSDGRHLTRARRLFERAGFEVLPAPSTDRATPEQAEDRVDAMRSLVVELMARLYYRVAGYL